MATFDFVDDCLDVLRGLPPILGVTTHGDRAHRMDLGGGPLVVDLDGGPEALYRLLVLPIERPTRSAIDLAATQLDAIRRPIEDPATRPDVPVIFAPHLGRSLMKHAQDRGLACVDAAGNVHLSLEPDHYIHVEGLRAPKPARASKVIRAAGYRVLFTLMLEPQLLDAPLRVVADNAETSVSAVQNMREWLESQRMVMRRRGRAEWNPAARERVLQLWLVGYQTVLRPSLVVGGLDLGWHPSKLHAPETREEEIQARLVAAGHTLEDWRWGGSSAAFRVGGHYRESDVSTIHIDLKNFGESGNALRELGDALGARPSREGMLRVLDIPNALAMPEGEEDPEPSDVVDPLLIWAETMLSPDPRARESAEHVLDLTELHAASSQ